MNEKTKQLTLSATILAAAAVLLIVQIPIVNNLGLYLDFSLVALLIGRRYVGFWNSFIISTIYPWFSLLFGGNPVGALFLVLQAWVLLVLDAIINKRDMSIFGTFMIIVMVTLWSVVLNVFLIGPLFSMGDGYTYLDGWVTWMTISLIFNPFKLGIVYGISAGLWLALENSFNLDANDEYIDEKIKKLEEKKAQKEQNKNND